MNIVTTLTLKFIGIVDFLFILLFCDEAFFWHAKTGRWIWQHNAFPAADSLSFPASQLAPLGPDNGRMQFILRQYLLAQLCPAKLPKMRFNRSVSSTVVPINWCTK